MKLVIIGGVAGGATAAARARRLDEHAEIVVFERGQYVSFANCGLPYYIGEVIKERDALLLSSPEMFKNKYNIEVRVGCEVGDIDRRAKTVSVTNLQTGDEYTESYDKLILSPGAEPIKPPLPGIDLPGVLSLRSIPDSDAIKALVDGGNVKKAVVIGGGFIGLEMAENLVHRGVEVCLVEALDQVMPPIDYEMATLVHDNLRAKGVDLRLRTRITGFEKTDSGLRVTTEGGGGVDCDLALMSVGVRPENELGKKAGLELGPRGHFVVDSTLCTADPDIYAVGDAIQLRDYITGLPLATALAGPANRQGRIAADNAMGRKSVYRGTQGTSVLGLFGQTVASTGPSQKFLEANSIAHQVTYSTSANHAGYYPDSEMMAVKLIWKPGSGEVLGGQIVGGQGVDKRIDVLATAARAGLTVFDLEELDLAYAPPFGSARDPINVAGMVAANILRGDMEATTPQIVEDLDPQKEVLLDVRFDDEVEELGTIKGSVHIPLPQLRSRLGQLDKSKRYYAYCAIGLRGYLAYRILVQNGFDVINIMGGFNLFRPWLGTGEGAVVPKDQARKAEDSFAAA